MPPLACDMDEAVALHRSGPSDSGDRNPSSPKTGKADPVKGGEADSSHSGSPPSSSTYATINSSKVHLSDTTAGAGTPTKVDKLRGSLDDSKLEEPSKSVALPALPVPVEWLHSLANTDVPIASMWFYSPVDLLVFTADNHTVAWAYDPASAEY
ncbi:hypothetical protein DACRYDRAFT_105305 [Dacryopinax primogenitus]|uniref:Uncharacterized protein n=1 Tax=Dacryopinax primogenitus (strain DJM 731) TaxID=1858805 RepID=M5G6C4_DACPD|nr:uncharacterized protein DACRYDRAFT_105305 [Dacryopinax primogenitus]EJU04239.1 hypothetical protein DACRYDRAFT_105305 [Dacryopinax primogenitus]